MGKASVQALEGERGKFLLSLQDLDSAQITLKVAHFGVALLNPFKTIHIHCGKYTSAKRRQKITHNPTAQREIM